MSPIRQFVTAGALLCLSLASAKAVPFSPQFSDYSFPGTQYTVDAPANAFFYTNYGITIDNAYLYKDGRDTFDGIGVSTGEVSEIGTTQTGRINFADTTDFVTMEYWTIMNTTYSVLDASNNVLGTIAFGSNLLGSYTFNSLTPIAALIWTSQGGFGQVTGLTYDFDGTTDGRNDDTGGGGNRVPDSATTLLMIAPALGFFALLRRRTA